MEIDADEGLLWTLAERRIADARELLEPPSFGHPRQRNPETCHLQAAYYLAGYAIECALKGHIVRLQRRRTRRKITTWGEARACYPNLNLSGREGHKLRRLLMCSGLDQGLRQDARLSGQWSLCEVWSSEARYIDSPFPADRARSYVSEFVKACEDVRSWVYSQGR